MMWWKIYFWIFLILSIIGLIFFFGQLKTWSFADWFEVITSIIALIGVYAYVYKKKILSSQFWIIFFWIIIVNWLSGVVYAFTPLEEAFPLPDWLTSKTVTNEMEMLLTILLSSPVAYAIYKLGQKKS